MVGSSVTVCLPALIRSASSSPSNGNGPMPSMPFSLCSFTSMPSRDVVRHQRRDADAEVDVEAVLQFARGARGHLIAGPGHCRCPPQATARLRTVRCSIRFS